MSPDDIRSLVERKFPELEVRHRKWTRGWSFWLNSGQRVFRASRSEGNHPEIKFVLKNGRAVKGRARIFRGGEDELLELIRSALGPQHDPPSTPSHRIEEHKCNHRHYLARLSFNSSEWRNPTRDAQAKEQKGTYNQKFGFGHEDWLFREEWAIDEWRYGFVQGVNKSHKKLVSLSQTFDLTLFTIDEQKRRRYVARILGAECLKEDDAQRALDVFKRRGWYDIMKREVAKVGGDPKAISDTDYARHFLNIRFRRDSLRPFSPDRFAESDDPLQNLNRYTLTDLDPIERQHGGRKPTRSGSSKPPTQRPYMRGATPPVQVSPEHAEMQRVLMEMLQIEFPSATVECEENFVDVTVVTDSEVILSTWNDSKNSFHCHWNIDAWH